MESKTRRLELRFPESALRDIDRWRHRQDDRPSRSKAIRQLVAKGLTRSQEDVRFSPGETLLVTMLCDIHRSLRVDSDVDTRLIGEAIAGGHLWGLKQAYPGLYHDEVDDPQDVRETLEIMDMWTQLQAGLGALEAERHKALATELATAGCALQFPGFDANSEPHYRILRFLIDQLGRHADFRELELNSRAPTLDRHRRMLRAYRHIRGSGGAGLTDQELVRVLMAGASADASVAP